MSAVWDAILLSILAMLPDAVLWDLSIVLISSVAAFRLGFLVLMSAAHVRRGAYLPTDGPLERLSVIVPAYNEDRVLGGSIRTIMRSDHPDFEVLIVDDGSTDQTLSVARAIAKEDPRIKVLAQPQNRGKAQALNRGITECSGSVVVTVDADTLLAADTLRLLAAPLVDPDIDAVASNVKVGNRLRWLNHWQSAEYIMGLNIARRAQDMLGCITTLPGAACAFRRDAIEQAGGYSSDTLIEDTDLTIAMLRHGSRAVYQPLAHAFTESPDTLRGLYRQRSRWMLGYLQCLYKHRSAFFRRGMLGWFGMPNLLFTHFLIYLMVPLSIPAIGRLLHWTTLENLLGALAGFFGLEILLAAAAYLADREDWTELIHIPLRRLGWPWFLLGVFYSVWWRIIARREIGWEKLERAGVLADFGLRGEGTLLRNRRTLTQHSRQR